MISLLRYWQIGAGLVLGALLAAGPVYLVGKSAGRQDAATQALETSVKVLRDRNITDEEISASDLAGMCSHFGLPEDDQRECVRRLEAADADAGVGR